MFYEHTQVTKYTENSLQRLQNILFPIIKQLNISVTKILIFNDFCSK